MNDTVGQNMNIDRAKEIADFQTQVAELANRLSVRGVAIEKIEYQAEVFGCWGFVAGTKEKKFDFSYDGKDSTLMFHDTAIVPKDYRDVQQRRFRTQDREDPLAYVGDFLAREFPLK